MFWITTYSWYYDIVDWFFWSGIGVLVSHLFLHWSALFLFLTIRLVSLVQSTPRSITWTFISVMSDARQLTEPTTLGTRMLLREQSPRKDVCSTFSFTFIPLKYCFYSKQECTTCATWPHRAFPRRSSTNSRNINKTNIFTLITSAIRASFSSGCPGGTGSKAFFCLLKWSGDCFLIYFVAQRRHVVPIRGSRLLVFCDRLTDFMSSVMPRIS